MENPTTRLTGIGPTRWSTAIATHRTRLRGAAWEPTGARRARADPRVGRRAGRRSIVPGHHRRGGDRQDNAVAGRGRRRGQGGHASCCARPVEAELPIGYAALADLLGEAVRPLVSGMPAVQRTPSRGRWERHAPGRPVGSARRGSASLTVLSCCRRRRRVVVAIDDVAVARSIVGTGAGLCRKASGRCSMLVADRACAMATLDPLDTETAFGAELTRIELGGLSLGAIAHIVRRRVDGSLSRPRLARIHERAAGNPFHAQQLARVGDDELPRTLAAGLDQRLAEAPDGAAPVLELLAIRGPMADCRDPRR